MAKDLGARCCPASVGAAKKSTARPPLLLRPRLQQRRGARPGCGHDAPARRGASEPPHSRDGEAEGSQAMGPTTGVPPLVPHPAGSREQWQRCRGKPTTNRRKLARSKR
eukprot:12420779-Alexandrium_andersonii.AAC.1